MTDATPASADPPPPPPAVSAGSDWGPRGQVRSPLFVVVMWFVTLGIYGLYWQYQVFRELKDHTHEGIGGGIGLLLAIFLGIVNVFLLPSEVGNMYAKAGLHKPVHGVTGFWVFLPIIGFIVWVVKVQGALNHRWDNTAG
jgi:hypothetical protein